jgi:hypothetical protein
MFFSWLPADLPVLFYSQVFHTGLTTREKPDDQISESVISDRQAMLLWAGQENLSITFF